MSNTRTIHESNADKNVRANSSGHSVIGVVSRTLDIPRFDRGSGRRYIFLFLNVNNRSEALPECGRKRGCVKYLVISTSIFQPV